ncbi:ATP-binding protein [Candidatus Woesearchaeota archaeon]|nr:ATP-binding protein [Candidatus Woesearchaeota archaeon]
MAEYPVQFIRGIQDDNPWWQTGKPRQGIPQFKRSDCFKFIEEISTPSVHVLIGSRRAGKTTLIDQIIQHLIEEKKVDPKRIFFVSLERPYFELVPEKLLNAIEFFEQNVYGKPLSQASETVYLFIDEAQYDHIWARLLKQYRDQKKKIFAIVSGSSSTAVYKDTAESGAGRFDTHHMMTMKFRDVTRLRIAGKENEIYALSKELRDAFVLACKRRDPAIYARVAARLLPKLTTLPVSIEKVFAEYLLKGGYPEFYTSADWKQISTYYQANVFDAIIQKDVVNVFDLKFPQRIRKLLVQILELSGSILSRHKLAESLQMAGRLKTLDQYIEALSEACLIRTAIKYKASRGRPSTKEKKFFAADIGLRNAILGIEQSVFTGHELGEVIETVAFNHALRLGFHVDKQVRTYGYYWRASEGAGERDIVIDIRRACKTAIPIEIKSGQCGVHDIKKMRATISDIDAPFGIITCKDRLGIQDNVLIVPTWLFLLTC